MIRKVFAAGIFAFSVVIGVGGVASASSATQATPQTTVPYISSFTFGPDVQQHSDGIKTTRGGLVSFAPNVTNSRARESLTLYYKKDGKGAELPIFWDRSDGKYGNPLNSGLTVPSNWSKGHYQLVRTVVSATLQEGSTTQLRDGSVDGYYTNALGGGQVERFTFKDHYCAGFSKLDLNVK